MPLIENALPSLLSTLHGPNPPDRPTLIFFASRDETGRMWCGDCRDVEDLVKETFSPEDAPTGIIIYVGDQPTWKAPNNQYRREYGLTSVPTIVKLEDGKESARLVESEITKTSLRKFLA